VELTRVGNIVGMSNSADLSSDSGVLLHPLLLSNYCDSKKEVLVRSSGTLEVSGSSF